MNRRLCLLLTFFYCCFFFSQNYNVSYYTTDNGLPQNSVKDITKDKYGFIWLTTENGVVRYDGTNFVGYKNILANNQRFAYFYGNIQNDSIFANDCYDGTIIINKKNPHSYKGLKRIRNNIISYKNYNYILYCNKANIIDPYTGIGCYIETKKGVYYIKEGSVLYKDNITKKERKVKIRVENKLDMFNFFTINNILFYIDKGTKKILRIQDDIVAESFNNQLITDSKSKIFWSQINDQTFIVNNNCIYHCRYKDGQLLLLKLLDINVDKDCISIYYDKSYNILYLGSRVSGLQIVKFLDFFATKKNPGQQNNFFYSIVPYDSAKVITSYGEIYNNLGLSERKYFKTVTPYFIDYDSEKNILLEGDLGIFLYHKEDKYKSYRIIKRDKSLVSFFCDNKKYYTATRRLSISNNPKYIGIVAIFKEKSFKNCEKQIIFSHEPTKVIKYNHDNILVGTIKQLYKVSLATNKIYNLSPKGFQVRDIIKTEDGNFWITTTGQGFYLLKKDQLIKMPNDIDENLQSAHTILEDRNGFFWIPSNNGLYRVSKNELLEYSRNKNKKINYYRFKKEDGFNTNEFNGGGNSCGTTLKNGEFVLPSMSGLVF